MKQFLIPTATLWRAAHVLFLALILVACSAVPVPTGQPTSAPPEPTQTPVIVVQTVIVEATQAATELPPTPVAPTATPVVVTVVVEPTQAPPTDAPAAAAPTQAASGGPILLDDALGAGYFVSIARDRNDLSLRCSASKEINFSVKPNTTDITQVDFYYRIEDRASGAVFDWQNAGRMIPDAGGNFVINFSGEDVHANFRKPNAWFDYQFIGSNATGVVGRSAKIEKQVTYTFDCP